MKKFWRRSKAKDFLRVFFIFFILTAVCTGVSKIAGTEAFAENAYTFSKVINPPTISVDNGTDVSAILSQLPSKLNVEVEVSTTTPISTTEKKTWSGVATVSWNSAPNETYDKTSKSARNLTWAGTVKAQKIESGKETAYIPEDQPVTATVYVKAGTYNILTYDGVSEGKFTGDASDLGLKWSNQGDADDNYDLDRRILAAAAQTDSNIENAINNAMLNDKSIYLRLVATEKDEDEIKDSITSKIEEAAEKSESDAKIGKYFDLSLYAVIGEKSYQITNTGDDNAIKIKYTISTSASFYKAKSTSGGTTTTRYYRVYRHHSSSAEKVSGDWSSSTSLTIKSSLFSIYATAYYDDESSSSSTSPSTSSLLSSNSSKYSSSSLRAATSPIDTIDSTGGTGGTSGSKAPKTGDEFNAKMWIFFIVVGVVVALCSFILFQDTKEWQEENKTES